MLRDEILPRVNQFCYGQVKSAHGSGQFKKDLDGALGDEDVLVTSSVNDRTDMPEAIRSLPGQGPLAVRLKSDLPAALKYEAVIIESAARDAGLDFFDVVFELLEARDVNGVAAYGGFPVRFPSWRFGMEYERLEKGRQWGLSKIYELVINNDPTYAYLVRSNSLLEQKLVMAHVYGHADFFKHNLWFAPTDRQDARHDGQPLDVRLRRYIDALGQERSSGFIDLVPVAGHAGRSVPAAARALVPAGYAQRLLPAVRARAPLVGARSAPRSLARRLAAR